METRIIFDEARSNIVDFFNEEFNNFDNLLLLNFLNRINDFLNYNEEGIIYKPKLIFTNNIDAILKSVEKPFMLPIYEDDNATNFNQRLKPIIALATNDWCIYIEQKDGKIRYGLCRALNSIKEKQILSYIENDEQLKAKNDKLDCIIAKFVNYSTLELYSISDNKLTINMSFNSDSEINNEKNINSFVDDTFSKLRTTKQKLSAIKTMYSNIFHKVVSEVNGSICVVVDKDYEDNGFFEDGIWLKEPISFNKLFTNAKSYSEEKLQAFVQLFIAMLRFDGITIVDNFGRIRAYNVFVETDNKKSKGIVGGARKRAAYTIINSRRKHIVGVYFQSHEGEIFYKSLVKPSNSTKHESKTSQVESDKTKINEIQKQEEKTATLNIKDTTNQDENLL